MPSCKELTELVTDYLEGRLQPRVEADFLKHIKRCDVCEYYLKQMQQTVDALGHVPREPLTPEAEQAFAEAFRNWKNGK